MYYINYNYFILSFISNYFKYCKNKIHLEIFHFENLISFNFYT